MSASHLSPTIARLALGPDIQQGITVLQPELTAMELAIKSFMEMLSTFIKLGAQLSDFGLNAAPIRDGREAIIRLSGAGMRWGVPHPIQSAAMDLPRHHDIDKVAAAPDQPATALPSPTAQPERLAQLDIFSQGATSTSPEPPKPNERAMATYPKVIIGAVLPSLQVFSPPGHDSPLSVPPDSAIRPEANVLPTADPKMAAALTSAQTLYQPPATLTSVLAPRQAYSSSTSLLGPSAPQRTQRRRPHANVEKKLLQATWSDLTVTSKNYPDELEPAQDQAGRLPVAPAVRQGILAMDGSQLGRWIIEHLERNASRPGSMATGIDPRITPIYAGAPTGV